jgi:predicted SAM-dependent methyltransferase
MAVKLNIGAGNTVIEGYTPIDRKTGVEAYPLPHPDNSVDDIRASHVLEHLTFAKAGEAMRDWYRALKPGGRLRIAVPDVDKVMGMKRADPLWRFYLMGGQTDADDIHQSCYDEALLSQAFGEAGFVHIERWESDGLDTSSHDCSLNLEGFKPDPSHNGQDDKPAKELDIKVKAVMSVPRYGSLAARGVMQDALKPFGLNLHTTQGVFWGQCMQRMFEEAVEEGIDWILTLDYDSVFRAEDLDHLFGVLGNNPHIDALAALQCRRANKTPLMTAGKAHNIETDHSPIKVTTAHFGLTLIRADVLATIPKPWFYAEPEKVGTWGDERLDDDIWFWHQWRLAGKTIYVDPECRIGHVEEAVSYFDETLEPRLCPVQRWKDRFLPK